MVLSAAGALWAGASAAFSAPGMNAAAADSLIAGRPYTDMLAVDRKLGSRVSDKKALYAHLWKPIDLNKASKDDLTGSTESSVQIAEIRLFHLSSS